jgi:hypothetical protein
VDLLLHAQVRSRLAMVTWWPAASCTGSGRVLSRGKKKVGGGGCCGGRGGKG